MLSKVSNLPKSLPEDLNEWRDEYGLSMKQARLYKELKKEGFGMDGRMVREVETETVGLDKGKAEELIERHLKGI